MIIVCDQCKTRFQLDERAINREVFKARCAKCGHVFTVYTRPPEDEPVDLRPDHIVREKRYRILTICNQKGGVAKTSTCINLGAALSMAGKKVLLVDFDVQANLSDLLGCAGGKSFFDVLEAGGETELPKAILKVSGELFCLPSNSRMALFSKKYLGRKGFERILRDHLQRVANFFDFVLIDTPPSLDFFTLNALVASDFAIIPTQAEYLAVKGVGHVENIIDVLREKTGHKVDYKVLMTMYDTESMSGKVVRENLQRRLGDGLFHTAVVRDPKVQESQIVRSTVLQYDQSAPASEQYRALASEVLGL